MDESYYPLKQQYQGISSPFLKDTNTTTTSHRSPIGVANSRMNSDNAAGQKEKISSSRGEPTTPTSYRHPHYEEEEYTPPFTIAGKGINSGLPSSQMPFSVRARRKKHFTPAGSCNTTTAAIIQANHHIDTATSSTIYSSSYSPRHNIEENVMFRFDDGSAANVVNATDFKMSTSSSHEDTAAGSTTMTTTVTMETTENSLLICPFVPSRPPQEEEAEEEDDQDPALFPVRLYEMLQKAPSMGFQHIVSWTEDGKKFKVHNPKEFESFIMPLFFKQQTKYKSFLRQLNLYEFCRTSKQKKDRGGYYHERFIRGNAGLCATIFRSHAKRTEVARQMIREQRATSSRLLQNNNREPMQEEEGNEQGEDQDEEEGEESSSSSEEHDDVCKNMEGSNHTTSHDHIIPMGHKNGGICKTINFTKEPPRSKAPLDDSSEDTQFCEEDNVSSTVLLGTNNNSSDSSATRRSNNMTQEFDPYVSPNTQNQSDGSWCSPVTATTSLLRTAASKEEVDDSGINLDKLISLILKDVEEIQQECENVQGFQIGLSHAKRLFLAPTEYIDPETACDIIDTFIRRYKAD